MSSKINHEHYMREALKEARKALEIDEIPIGAVVVCQGKIVARAYNMTERLNDVTAHAEMQAITSAANYLGGKYLDQCILYVTIEPCPMCAAATMWAQVKQIVYGARDVKRGFMTVSKKLLHPKTILLSGVLEKECAGLMIEFFRKKRK